MGMRPEEMERWGAASIFKESGRLLHKHYRLFLPFFLALYLPISIARLLQTSFLSPSSSPFLVGSIAEGSVNTEQTNDPPGRQALTTILSWTLFFYVVGTLGAGAVYYITDHLYTPTDIDDDRSIFHKVIKFLPRAFLRMFITLLWKFLADLLVYLFSFILGGILYAIVYAATGWSDLNLLFFVLPPMLAGIIFLAIVFALGQVIAVLEPGNYGIEALKRSTKLVRNGRAWTIVAVTLTTAIVLGAMLTLPTHGIMTGEAPVWAKVVVGVVTGGMDSVLRVYFGVVSVVMYFVYKARFDAAGSAEIQVFKLIDSAEHSYDPIVQGKGSDTFIDEP